MLYIKILVLVALLLLLMLILISPVEALGWWAGWFGFSGRDETAKGQQVQKGEDHRHFVVYLGGVNDVSREYLSTWERTLLYRLEEIMPEVVVVKDVYPYSPTNTALSTRKLDARIWRWLQKHRKRYGQTILAMLINFKNVIQVCVVADPRYGPFYNLGMAQSIYQRLLAHGYPADSRLPVTLIGYSGGGPIAVGASTFLKRILLAPVYIISLAGVLCSDRGLLEAEHVYHLYGTGDTTHRLAKLYFPGRWKIWPHSNWNKAMRAHKISKIPIGSMQHTGKKTYFSDKHFAGEKRSYADQTLEYLSQYIRKIETQWSERYTTGEP